MAPGTASADAADAVRFRYSCDAGQTLLGSAQGRVTKRRFQISLESRYIPASQGIEYVRQTMTGTWLRACKVRPDADDLKVKAFDQDRFDQAPRCVVKAEHAGIVSNRSTQNAQQPILRGGQSPR